ncbi:outer membrane protein assembly factor BamC [Atopomonas sediminilitoris]|uniref:outer membrane protein assembly factor BamC n=1 Tax=Atopomonas sediminilitoris TaxID=2919919 RepID=UPI001F4DD482|nr:outer membrane protein assembly factor BamC [Atopomonas sediminilitoris]MCJ8168874.1 outer membrane protein assembly factor BamC [Atopomonas sediminilitoris]
MKHLAKLSVLTLAIAGASGCGWIYGEKGYFRDRSDDYLKDRVVAPMQVPAGQETRPLDPLLAIPSNVSLPTTKPGEYEVPRPTAMRIKENSSEFSLQKQGERRWVIAQRLPSELWPATRQFFDDNGFNLTRERPQTGELDASWVELSQLNSALQSRLQSRVQNLSPTQHLAVRIEPGVQRNTSEIHVTAAPSSASLEGALLDELMLALARNEERGGSVSLLAGNQQPSGQFFDSPGRVNYSEDGNGMPLLNLDSDFNRAWSSVGRALEEADIRVDDLNRTQGIYYINIAEGSRKKAEEKKGWFSGMFSSDEKYDENTPGERYQLRLTQYGERIQINLEKSIETAAPVDVSREVLQRIQEYLY